MPKNKIFRKTHCTRVNYSYVLINTGETVDFTDILDGWLTSIIGIQHKLESKLYRVYKQDEARIYCINSVEHVTITKYVDIDRFNSIAAMDKNSIEVIKKLR